METNIGWIGNSIVLCHAWFEGLSFRAERSGVEESVLIDPSTLRLCSGQAFFARGDDGSQQWHPSIELRQTTTVMLGVFAGHVLRSQKTSRTKVLWLVGMGVGSLALGWIWGIWFPVIKHLWTSSFVLFSAGICLLLLALFYLVIDVWAFKKWAFGFVVIGMNAIAVYMATHVFNFRHIGDIFVNGLDKWCGQWSGFIHAVAAFAVIWLILWWMYRKKSFIKIWNAKPK